MAVQTSVQVSVFSIILDLYLEVELLGHMVVLYFTFWEIAKLFSIAVASFYIPSRNTCGSNFSMLSPSLVIFQFFLNYRHSSWCEVVSHRGFDLYFLND